MKLKTKVCLGTLSAFVVGGLIIYCRHEINIEEKYHYLDDCALSKKLTSEERGYFYGVRFSDIYRPACKIRDFSLEMQKYKDSDSDKYAASLKTKMQFIEIINRIGYDGIGKTAPPSALRNLDNSAKNLLKKVAETYKFDNQRKLSPDSIPLIEKCDDCVVKFIEDSNAFIAEYNRRAEIADPANVSMQIIYDPPRGLFEIRETPVIAGKVDVELGSGTNVKFDNIHSIGLNNIHELSFQSPFFSTHKYIYINAARIVITWQEGSKPPSVKIDNTGFGLKTATVTLSP